MKKLLLMVLSFAVCLGVTGNLYAHEGDDAKRPAMDRGMGMMDERMPGQRMGMKAGQGMMAMMAKPAMVSSSEGGAIVLAGNQLLKYDKNLNLVKSVEIEFDYEGMHRMMGHMMDMMGGMRGDQAMGPGMMGDQSMGPAMMQKKTSQEEE